MKKTTESLQVHSSSEQSGDEGLMNPDITLLILTWVTFFLLLAILQKFAWKPILAGLAQREETIRRSLEDAEKTRQELERIEETRQEIITKADDQAKTIVTESRQAAHNASKVITEKTKEGAQIILENANREVKAEFARAQEKLRQESAETAVALASKLIEENLDNTKNRKLVEKLIKKI